MFVTTYRLHDGECRLYRGRQRNKFKVRWIFTMQLIPSVVVPDTE